MPEDTNAPKKEVPEDQAEQAVNETPETPETSTTETAPEVPEQPTEPETTPEEKPTEQPVPKAAEPAPSATPEAVADQLVPASSTITLVWQWLTYGLWFWTLASLSILLSATLAFFIGSNENSSDHTWMVYIIATTLCLLPISYFVDRVYSKQEPDHKHGFSGVILVIHAVIAFLVSIGALITAVVTLLSLATDVDGEAETKATVIASALLIAALSALFFARIVRPAKILAVTKKFGLIVTIVSAITVIAALAGPYIATIGSRSDRKIESGLYEVNSAIQTYVSENKKLPESLNDLEFSSYQDRAEDLVEENLVEYRKLASDPNAITGETPVDLTNRQQLLHYELCVTYKNAKGDGDTQISPAKYPESSYIDTYSHPAGRTCYKQTAAVYQYQPL